MISWMKNVNNFQIAKKFSLVLLLTICLIFWKFQPDVAYESVACKRKECNYKGRIFCGNSIFNYTIKIILTLSFTESIFLKLLL